MSTPPVNRIEIEVGDFPLDSSFIEHQGTYTLFLRPQTFGSAVQHVRNVLPHITLEAAESMVREQCPEFPDFDKLMGLDQPPAPSIERPADPPVKEDVLELERRKRRRRAVLVAALLPALAASWAVGRYTNVANTSPDHRTAAAAPDASADVEGTDTEEAPFTEPKFTHFAGASNIDCDPISPLEAECTDADGKVMSTKAATGPDSTLFTFSYGSERIGLRIFYDAEYAGTWARQDGTQDLYPNLEMHSRYALWGTDRQRIKDYGALIADSERTGTTPMGGAKPLPPRLAALTLGTLGLDQSEVHQLMAQPPAPAPSDTPTIMAARLVLGLDQVPPTPAGASTPEGDDIVAIAAGIEPSPSTGGETAPETSTEPVTTIPARDTATGGTAPASPTPKPPPTSTAPPAEPTPETQEPTAPPTNTKPPAETKPPSTAPPAETPPPQPSKPPEESTPPDDTAPVETPPAGSGEPAEETPAPPVEELPEPPVEGTPAPADPPAEETAPPLSPAPGQDEDGDDLLVLNSAWTVRV
ncbi:hypothetical protein KVH27_35435 [Streptomyces olivaceus]|uniref:hypothetical protein n=1 Tax=Streptomyces olivaceus TaxID=47716 RepID=UPI001CD01843|nr:hypothetical protein [Streptomyces olivaceus]MBZ6253645.1 hypothetical protein [Streptomyces olivaceus]